MRALLIVVLLAAIACRRSAPADDKQPHVPSPTVAAALDAAAPLDATAGAAAPLGPTAYAGLVRPGARWSFRVHHGDAGGVLPDQLDFARGDRTLDCWVEEAVTFANGRAASIDCDEAWPDEADRHPLIADWGDTAAGLYRLSALPLPDERLDITDDDNDDTDDGLFLAAAPVAAETTEVEPADEEVTEERSTTTKVAPLGTAWCASSDYGATFGEGWRLCVDADGPVEGSYYWESLTDTHSTIFRRAPTPKPKAP